MNADTSVTLRIFIAFILAIMLISSSLVGRPGSVLGALIDAEDMVDDTVF